MSQMASRELLMASSLSVYGGRDSNSSSDGLLVIRANETGAIDLSRLQLGAVEVIGPKGDEGWKFVDVLPSLTVERIVVYNTVDLIRGQGHPRTPAAVFSPLRQYGAIQLGVWKLDTGSTVEIKLSTEALRRDHGVRGLPYFFSAAAPFEPVNRRDYVLGKDLSRFQATYAGTMPSIDEKDPKATVKIDRKPFPEDKEFEIRTFVERIEFDQDGIADLGSLQLLDASEGLYQWRNTGISRATLESILLPTREQVVIGEGPGGTNMVRAPAAIFASDGRRFDWVNFGLLEVASGSLLEIRLGQLAHVDEPLPEVSPFHAGLQFFPRR